MIEDRWQVSGTRSLKGPGPVMYWMQAAVRVRDNPALVTAWNLAREHQRPLGVFFALDEAYPGANRRSYDFLVRGLQEAARELQALGVELQVFRRSGAQVLESLKVKPGVLVMDRGVMPVQKLWQRQAAEAGGRGGYSLILVDSETAVPLEKAGEKAHWSAATLRRRMTPLIPFYAQPFEGPSGPAPQAWKWEGGETWDWPSLEAWVRRQPGPEPVNEAAGERGAWEALEAFCAGGLEGYDEHRSDPSLEGAVSGLSPWLHFGHLSPRSVYKAVLQASAPGPDKEAFLEELLVRRDLSFNYMNFHPAGGTFEGLPDWARKTLEAHRRDPREVLYTLDQWESAGTHDSAWNAAQTQLVRTGRMQGYMRMYWGKKILEWSASPQEAFKTALGLNDKYALDGRDPNSVAGVAWCLGLHDRPWQERKVFGMVRYMNYAGLQRKFDIKVYEERWGRKKG